MAEPSPLRRRDRLARLAVVLAGLLLTFTLSAGLAVSRLEEDDRFCAACHMTPERTYYNRAQFALAGQNPLADLSSAHYVVEPAGLPHRRPFRCIDCHRGDEGIVHRLTALTLGARDTAIYLFGQPDQTIEQTAIEVPVLLTESCLKCHTASLLVVGFGNHFHNKLPAAFRAWRDGGPLALPPGEDPALYQLALENGLEPVEIDLLCVDCHLAHVSTPGAELVSFMDLDNVVYPACEECHAEALGAPLGLSNPDAIQP